MSFLGWTFLFGAAAVVGPIVAHMLAKPRFRRVPFTMVQFLRTGRHESHSRRNLRDLLVLLLRCAIIVLIAMLFARPMLRIHAAPHKNRSMCYFALDDSASMAYRDGRSSLFDRMIETAIHHVREAPEDASFGVCGLASGRLTEGLGRSQAMAEIKRLTVVPKNARPVDFVSALRQAAQAASPGDIVSAVVLSDFTPGVLREFEQIRNPVNLDAISYEIHAPHSPVSNAAIAEARAIDVVGNELEADVVVANEGSTRQQRKLAMRCEDLRAVSVDVTLSPGERRVVRMRMDLGPGVRRASRVCLLVEVSLAPEDGLAADDTYRLAVCIPQATSATIVIVHRGDEAFLFEAALQALAGQSAAAASSVRKVQERRLTTEDLNGADVIVFSSLPADFACPTGPLKNCLARGGRLVFFATEAGNPKVLEGLMREGLLAALPQKWVPQVVYPEPQPAVGGGIVLGEQAAKSLANYRPDGIALKGYWLCRTSPDAECLWRLGGVGAGLLYARSSNGGVTILVSTSIDDSLGLLAKSGAWVAFCRFLAGESDRVRQFCLRIDERPALSLPEAMRVTGRGLVVIENCDGARGQAAVEGMRMVLPTPQGIGWMRTLTEPKLHVGVNLPQGETDLRRPAEEAVAGAMKRAFVIDPGRERGFAHAGPPTQSKPIWRTFVWATIVLLLLEPAITNRLKR